MMQEFLVPDLILLDGNVLCMDAANSTAQAIAIKDNKIIAVGSTKDISELAGKKTEIINLAGRTVLPGFTDGHTHVEWYGRDQLMVNLLDCKTEDEALQRLKEKVEQAKPGEWIAACAVPIGVMAPCKGRFTLKEIDAFSPNNPVFIDCASVEHSMWMNSYALNLYNITKDSYPEDIRDGQGIARDANGEPNGKLEGAAWNWGLRAIKPYSLDWYQSALDIGQKGYLAVGVTAAHNAWEDPYILSGWQTLEEQGKLKMRQFISLDIEQYSDRLIDGGLHKGFGSDFVKLMQFKVILNVPPNAAVYEDYVGMPGNRGYHLYPPEWIEEKVLYAVQNGWSVCAHVTGDADTDMMVTAYEKALNWYKKETGLDNTSLRLRLEHTTMVTPELIKRIAAAKILSNVEPCGSLSPQHRPGGESEKILGPERFKIHRPLKALFDAGINVNFGSDYPMPYGFIDPRASIFAALDGCGKPWDVITPYQALQAYTINGAYGVYSEDKFGSIEPGKWADLVVYSDNPLTVPKASIWDPEKNTPTDLMVDYTLVAGEIVYQRE